jgi:hypothetical protein
VVRFGQREGTKALHPSHRRQPPLLLLLAAERRDRAHRKPGLHSQQNPEAAVAAAELHLDQTGGDRAHRRTAVALDPVADQS